jgi:hypothetical protein
MGQDVEAFPSEGDRDARGRFRDGWMMEERYKRFMDERHHIFSSLEV